MILFCLRLHCPCLTHATRLGTATNSRRPPVSSRVSQNPQHDTPGSLARCAGSPTSPAGARGTPAPERLIHLSEYPTDLYKRAHAFSVFDHLEIYMFISPSVRSVCNGFHSVPSVPPVWHFLAFHEHETQLLCMLY